MDLLNLITYLPWIYSASTTYLPWICSASTMYLPWIWRAGITTFKLTIDLSAYLSLDVGLDRLEAYDLRDLSQPIRTSCVWLWWGVGAGSPEKTDESAEDDSKDADFDVENEQLNTEEDCSESLVDLDDHGSIDDSDADELLQAALEGEIPRNIFANAEDDDGNPTENVWNKMYENGNM